MKKTLLAILLTFTIGASIGCTNTDMSTIDNNTDTIEDTQDIDNEEVKEEEVKEEEVKKLDKEENLMGAYSSVETLIVELMGELDYTYEILDGDIYLTMYISEEEMMDAVTMGALDDHIDTMKKTSTSVKDIMKNNGYDAHSIKFNVAYCDNVKRQEKTYVVVRDGRVVYNRFE